MEKNEIRSQFIVAIIAQVCGSVSGGFSGKKWNLSKPLVYVLAQVCGSVSGGFSRKNAFW